MRPERAPDRDERDHVEDRDRVVGDLLVGPKDVLETEDIEDERSRMDQIVLGDLPGPELQVCRHAPFPLDGFGDLIGISPTPDPVHQGMPVRRGQHLQAGLDGQKEAACDEHGRADDQKGLASDRARLEVKGIVVAAQRHAAEFLFEPRSKAQGERGQGPHDDRIPEGSELRGLDDQGFVPDEQGIIFGRNGTPHLDVPLRFDCPTDEARVGGVGAGHPDEIDGGIPDPFDRRELGGGDRERPLKDIPDPPALAGEDEEDGAQGRRRRRYGPPGGLASLCRYPVVHHVPLRVKPDRG
ncbi:MAG: hypothetical protein MZV64_49820 [Ignavibacteriales bacterium]|nr:hypothetical protein [Ignavibacteriales bacterium]